MGRIIDIPGVGEVDLDEIEFEACYRSFSAFAKRAWQEIDPAELTWNWHLDAICLHLQAIEEGRIRRLVISVPPGHAKSLMVSVLWPAWRMLRRPSWKCLSSSYARELSNRDSRRTRMLIESDWLDRARKYVSRTYGIPEWGLCDDARSITAYETTAKGGRRAVGTGAATTGFRATTLIIDDPQNALDVHSEAERKATLTWWRESMSSRLDDMLTGEVVCIAQRLHCDDLPGYLLANGGFEHLCLPSEYDPDVCSCESCTQSSSIGWKDPRTEAGELLFPAKFPREVIEQAKKDLGERAYAAQHQQRPVPGSGNLIKGEWLQKTWGLPGRGATIDLDPQLARFDSWAMSVDATFSKSDTSDYVAIGVWARRGPDLYLLDIWHKRAGFLETMQAILDLRQAWHKCNTILIEKAANGAAIIETLRTKIPGVIAVVPKGSKESRVSSVLHLFEAGNVVLPYSAHSLARYRSELTSFPFAKNDDLVDMTSQALARLGMQTFLTRQENLLAIGKTLLGR